MSSRITLTVDKGRSGGSTYRFDQPMEFMVGRAKDCDIEVPQTEDYKDVSRHHCVFHIDPPRIWVSDLESKNGTFVNELKISSMVGQFRLYDEDELQIGPLRMSVHIIEQKTAKANDVSRATAIDSRWRD